MSKLISLLSLSFLFSFSPISSAHNLMAAIQSEDRSPKNVVRDEFRNPAETLTFFQIKPDMRVVELSPGGAVRAGCGLPCPSWIETHKSKKQKQTLRMRSIASGLERISKGKAKAPSQD